MLTAVHGPVLLSPPEQRLTFFEALDPETSAVVTRSEYVESVGIINHLDTNRTRELVGMKY